MSVNFVGWTGKQYSKNFINSGTVSYAKDRGVDDIYAPMTAMEIQSLVDHFDDFSINGEASSVTLQRALFADKFQNDKTAERAAILALSNEDLLNKWDGNDHNSVFTKNALTAQANDAQKAVNIYNAVNKFKDNTNVLEYFEYGINGNGAPKHGNDRFGTAALYELAKATPDDPIWSTNDTLSGIKISDRQGYIDAAKTIWNDPTTVHDLAAAGNDLIMKHQDFVDWINAHPLPTGE